MTGSLQTKNKKFYIVLNILENGKRKQKWIATGLPVEGNKRKATQMLQDKLLEYKTPTAAECSDILFSDCIRSWLKVVQQRVDVVTFQGYELMASTQVLPYFDNKGLKLCEITREQLQAFFDEKRISGRKDGKGGLSPSSLRQYKNIISQTLNEAMKNGVIASNPCQFVELPRKDRFEANFYNANQLKTLFDAIADDPLAPLIKVTALYGLRRSEVLGLKWDSVDFTTKLLTIKHTVSKVTEAVAKDKTKNATSHRSFPLTPEAEEIFLAALSEQKRNEQQFGKEYQKNDYVFKWATGKPFSPDYVTAHFSFLLEKHNLPHIRFHDLRHSCASLLLNNGFTLKDVQEYMGHADIQMTANIYGHLDASRKQLLVDKLTGSLC